MRLAEADQHGVPIDQQRPFDQHPIASQQLQLLILAHCWQLILELQSAVLHAAGIEEFLQRLTAELLPAAQLIRTGAVCFNIAQRVGEICRIQPRLGFLAGASFRVADKKHEDTSLIKNPGRSAAAGIRIWLVLQLDDAFKVLAGVAGHQHAVCGALDYQVSALLFDEDILIHRA